MNVTPAKVLVTGATGQVGGSVLRDLHPDRDLLDPAPLDAARYRAVAMDFDDPASAETADEVFDTYARITGRAPTTIEDFAHKHAAVFRY